MTSIGQQAVLLGAVVVRKKADRSSRSGGDCVLAHAPDLTTNTP